jgi:hypothetical protein
VCAYPGVRSLQVVLRWGLRVAVGLFGGGWGVCVGVSVRASLSRRSSRPSRTMAFTSSTGTSADDGLKWRFRALYPKGVASRGACVSYMGTNHTS